MFWGFSVPSGAGWLPTSRAQASNRLSLHRAMTALPGEGPRHLLLPASAAQDLPSSPQIPAGGRGGPRKPATYGGQPPCRVPKSQIGWALSPTQIRRGTNSCYPLCPIAAAGRRGCGSTSHAPSLPRQMEWRGNFLAWTALGPCRFRPAPHGAGCLQDGGYACAARSIISIRGATSTRIGMPFSRTCGLRRSTREAGTLTSRVAPPKGSGYSSMLKASPPCSNRR